MEIKLGLDSCFLTSFRVNLGQEISMSLPIVVIGLIVHSFSENTSFDRLIQLSCVMSNIGAPPALFSRS